MKDSEEVHKLCLRCQSLKLEQHITQRSTNETGGISGPVAIASSTVDNICALCHVFDNLFAICRQKEKARYTSLGALHQLQDKPRSHAASNNLGLTVHHHHSEPNTSLRYFSIDSSCALEPTVRLLPLLPTPDHVLDQGIDSGRVIDTAAADLCRVKQWMELCNKTHASCIQTNPVIPPRSSVPLRIIDCTNRRVRSLEHGEAYICLSYVWGAAGRREGTDTSALPETLPKTIEDTLHVAAQLGIPQVWVDQYCIDQSNIQEKAITIRNMDLIYGGAALTVIAAGGGCASSGLPGIRGTMRKAPRLVTVGSLQLLVSEDIGAQVRDSIWNSRGWTFQEGLLFASETHLHRVSDVLPMWRISLYGRPESEIH